MPSETFMGRAAMEADEALRALREIDAALDEMAAKPRVLSLDVEFVPRTTIAGQARRGFTQPLAREGEGGQQAGVLFDGEGRPASGVLNDGESRPGAGALNDGEFRPAGSAFSGFQRRQAVRAPRGAGTPSGGIDPPPATAEDIRNQTDAIVSVLRLLAEAIIEAGPEALGASMARRAEER